MIRRPPRSTPFPTRRSSDLGLGPESSSHSTFSTAIRPPMPSEIVATPPGTTHSRLRSEEHTSELQSQSNLVCRLLLEKKKRGKERETLPPNVLTLGSPSAAA